MLLSEENSFNDFSVKLYSKKSHNWYVSEEWHSAGNTIHGYVGFTLKINSVTNWLNIAKQKRSKVNYHFTTIISRLLLREKILSFKFIMRTNLLCLYIFLLKIHNI